MAKTKHQQRPARASAPPEHVLSDNVRAIAELERKALEERRAAERLSDAIARRAGSGRSAVLHVVFFALWIAINYGLIPGLEPFDPFPFSFLTLVVSLEAILLTVFVLMSQNRMTVQADKRANLDLQIDLLAEQELTAILQMVQALCRKQGVTVTLKDESIEELEQRTDIRHVASALEASLPKP
jgi:uncharacterized membrane protein